MRKVGLDFIELCVVFDMQNCTAQGKTCGLCAWTHRSACWWRGVCPETTHPGLTGSVQILASAPSSSPTGSHQDTTRTHNPPTLKRKRVTHVRRPDVLHRRNCTHATVAVSSTREQTSKSPHVVVFGVKHGCQILHTSRNTRTHTTHLSQKLQYIVLSGETDERPLLRPHQCACLREISEKWRRNQEESVFMTEP